MRQPIALVVIVVASVVVIVLVDLPPFGSQMLTAAGIGLYLLFCRLFPGRPKEATGTASPAPRTAGSNTYTLAAVIGPQVGIIAILLPSMLILGFESKLLWLGIFPACIAAIYVTIFLAIRADRAKRQQAVQPQATP